MPGPTSDVARAAAPVDAPAVCSCHTTSIPTPAGDIVVLQVFGDVEQTTHHVLQDALAEAQERHPSHLVVDVAGMGFCSVRGMALLAHAGTKTAAPGARYLLSGIRPHIERLMALLWPADTLPPRYPSAGAAALAAMARQRNRRSRERPALHVVGPPARPRLRAVGDRDRFGDLSDDELTARSRSGDGEAYRELARRHRTRMYRSALHMIGSFEDPDDVAQEIAARLRLSLVAFSEANPP